MTANRGAQVRIRLVGLAMVAALVGALTLTSAFYTRAFSDTVDISVRASRSGLIMDPGNKVKYRGVEIGRVASVEKTASGAVIELALDRDQAGRIPANVGAEIRASTIFGAKYVELVDVASPSGDAIATGAVIDARGVTREVNTLFERLDEVLSGVDVLAVNDTLSTLAGALEGRGTDIAELAATADRYLTALEPSLPQLRRDLRALADLSELGVRLEPALIRILDNASATSRTIIGRQELLDRLLVDVSLLGQTGVTVLGVNTDPLVYALRQLGPTTGMLADYASELPCFLRGLERSGKLAAAGAGGTSPGLNIIASLRKQIRPYSPATDRPQRLRGSGPVCGPLPYLGAGDIPAPDVED
jgi:phospholipid/cholesterol/gamma-HCH transport system substrate-binding protein